MLNRSTNRSTSVRSNALKRWSSVLSPWQNIDWWLMGLCVGLMVAGGVLIRSTQLHTSVTGVSADWRQHWITGLVGVIVAFCLARFRYDKLQQWPWIIYGITNMSLLSVKLIGTSALGAQSWINIGGFYVQPSEFAKVGVIVVLAAILAMEDASTLPGMFRALGILAVPWALVFIQPDLGSSLVFGAIALAMLYWANAKPGWLILLLSPLISAIVFGIATQHTSWLLAWGAWVVGMGLIGWRTLPWRHWAGLVALVVNLVVSGLGKWAWTQVLRPHQRIRLTSFLDPSSDPLGSGYHLIQSQIAIGGGQLWGRGLNQGTQTQGEFIPEQHTDFIFATVGEELGFVGGMVFLVISWLICLRLVIVAQNAKDNFGSLLAIGVLAMLLFQTLVNVGMTIGVSPVTGIPLPWLSYGRSALLTNFIALGLVEAVANFRRRSLP